MRVSGDFTRSGQKHPAQAGERTTPLTGSGKEGMLVYLELINESYCV